MLRPTHLRRALRSLAAIGLMLGGMGLTAPPLAAQSCTSGSVFYVGSSPLILDFPALTVQGGFGPSAMTDAHDVAVGPDGLLYVSSLAQSAVYRFDQSGAALGLFIAGGTGGLSGADGLAFMPNGDLLVVSNNTDQVLRFDSTGAFIGVFIDAAPGDPNGAGNPRNGIVFGPGGDLWLTFARGGFSIRRYDGTTGAHIQTYPFPVLGPRDLAFDRAGMLQIAARDGVYALDPATGTVTTTFDLAGGGTSNPTSVNLGPQGLLYVVERVPNDLISVIDPVSGTRLRTLPTPNATAKTIVVPCPLSLGDYVFLDNDGDGVFGAGDAAAPAGITLSLLDDLGSPVDADPVTVGVQPATATTNAAGQYLFDSLLAADYQVVVDASNFLGGGPLDGYLSSTGSTSPTGLAGENNLDHGIDSGTPSTTGIASGLIDLAHDVEPLTEGAPNQGSGFADDPDSDLTIDFGFVLPAPPAMFDLALRKQLATGQSSTVADGDDVRFTVTVFNQGGVDASGIVLTDTIPAGFVLSPLEPNWAMSGATTATVTLGGTLLAGGMTQVDILLRVTNAAALGTALNFAEISAALDGTGGAVADIDSTPDAISGNTQGEMAPALEDDQVGEDGTVAGEDEDDHDFASVTVVPTAPPTILSIGNVVWLDDDNDGVQDPGEAPLAAVQLRILDGSGNPLPPTVVVGSDTQTTDTSGNYLFLVNTPGTYLVQILPTSFTSGGALDGLISSTGALQENDPNNNGDLNDNGVDGSDPLTQGVFSNPIVLSLGMEPVGEAGNPGAGVADADSNLTVDFGFNSGAALYPVPGPSGVRALLLVGLVGWMALRQLRSLP